MATKKKTSKTILQFKVTLLGISPAIWRRVQVPDSYTFWDLHIAIQDAMGWLNYHLHEYIFPKEGRANAVRIGIPDEMGETGIAAGWEVLVQQHFTTPGDRALYWYDFGDDWEHEILFEGILLRDDTAIYPRCIAGARACPPEDCGGVFGYERLLEILKAPKHPERKEINEWLKGHAINYYPYKPEAFDPEGVKFLDPKKQLKLMLGRG